MIECLLEYDISADTVGWGGTVCQEKVWWRGLGMLKDDSRIL